MTATPNTNPLTYSGYVAAVATLAVTGATDANFVALIPQMLNYAELRIQRDLDLLPSQTDNDTYALTTGNNLIAISVDDFVTIQNIRVISGTARTPLTPVSKEWLDAIYSDSSYRDTPAYFAPYGGDAAGSGNVSMNFIVGPYPDQAYSLSITGTTRLLSLNSYANSPQQNTATTFISTFLPDLLLMASMVFVSGYQRNWSSASDDPQMPVNYEQQYQTLLKGAMGEELRKRFRASAWTSEASSPAATPNRT